MKLKSIFAIIAFMGMLGATNHALGQKSEIGLGVGGYNYTGDVSPNYEILENDIGGMAFYRHNMNDHFSWRANIGVGRISASDTPPYDAFGDVRQDVVPPFSTWMVEASFLLEYYFLQYKEDLQFLRWSPYVFLGAGMSWFSPHNEVLADNQGNPLAVRGETYSPFQPTLPLGVGFKYLLSPKISVSFEAAMHKTFFDYVDNLGGLNGQNVKSYKYGNGETDDLVYHLAITMQYTFYTIPCPFKPSDN